jgi:hypothetical protein
VNGERFMGRKPKIERDPISGGLMYESAIEWYRFLADEALFEEGDAAKSDHYISQAEAMSHGPQGGVINSRVLEEEIKRWNG